MSSTPHMRQTDMLESRAIWRSSSPHSVWVSYRLSGGSSLITPESADGDSGIAGSLAERLPILHIVGAPSTGLQNKQALLHHTLNTPTSFKTFSKMSEPLSCSQALLSSIYPQTDTTWTDAFDKVVTDVLEQCRPGYVEFPTDAVHHKVSSKGLEKKLVSHRSQITVGRDAEP